MATVESSISLSQSEANRRAQPGDSLRFDLGVALLSMWFIAGMFLDGWAHNNGRVDNTFFTPWHAVLYSGFAAVGALLVFTHFRNVTKGYAWTRALPHGYMPSLLGVAIFAAGGGFDFWWHSQFGFEANLEALLSPAHLVLATGALLFVSGPLRAAWGRRTTPKNRLEFLPLVISLFGVFSLLTFFMQYNHYMSAPSVLVFNPGREHFFEDVYGITSMLMPSAVFTGMMLFALRRWTLPVGTFTVILTLNNLLMWLMRQNATKDYPALLLVPVIAGVVADLILWRFKPSVRNVGALRLFAFVVPFVLFISYMIILNAIGTTLRGSDGLWWMIHMWLGAPILAGVVGLFQSFLVAPPAVPADNIQAE